MKNSRLFVVAIAIVICLGFLPAAREMRNYFSQTQAAKYELTPLVTESELAHEFESTIAQFKETKTPDDFFTGVVKQHRVEGLIEKYESVRGAFTIERQTSDVLKRRMDGVMKFASDNMQSQYGFNEMAAARQNYEVFLKPIESGVQTNTQASTFLLYGATWSMFVMFLVFSFRAQNFMHFVYELLSCRLLVASVAWPFFAAEYMKVQSNDYRSVAAMAKFAAVNLSVLLSAVLSAGVAGAQTIKKAKTGKRASVVIIDRSAELDDGKKPEAMLVISTKKDGTLLEAATIIGKTNTTVLGLVGQKISGSAPVDVDLYGGYRGDFKRGQPDSHRVFAGLRFFKSIPLNKDNTLQINVPFAQFEQYVKPKLKAAFFSTGQVFNRFKSKLRFGGEYTFRKEQRGKPFVAGGPFAGYNIFKNTRVEALLQYSNAGPPRWRLRTVVAF